LLAGEYPGGADPAAMRTRLDALAAAGITYFIDLTEAGELPPYDHLLPPKRAADNRDIVYVRKAIRDHGVPPAAVMTDILDYLGHAIAVGHQVYVHCRAGIGRTNTVAGCWLRRGGLSGPEAVMRLNRLWQANARSRAWPHVPETLEQEQFVLDWQGPGAAPELDPDMGATRALRGRYLGTVLGLAIGDAMGATLQFRKPGQFAAISDLQGGGHWQLPRGAWTDDTAMMLCAAQSLLERECCDTADQLRHYRRWQQDGVLSSTGECIGITAAVARSLGLNNAATAPAAPPLDAQALTRVAAVALFCPSSPERVIEWSTRVVRVTHADPRVLGSCRIYATLLLAALRGVSREALLEKAQAEREMLADLRCVLDTVAESTGFRDGLLRIVNLGEDADVRGALFGQLAGALYGVEGIPRNWRGAVRRRELLEDTADRLLAAALAPRD